MHCTLNLIGCLSIDPGVAEGSPHAAWRRRSCPVDVSMLQGKVESGWGKVMEDAARIECGDSRTAFWLHRKDLARRFRIAAGMIAQTAALFLPRL